MTRIAIALKGLALAIVLATLPTIALAGHGHHGGGHHGGGHHGGGHHGNHHGNHHHNHGHHHHGHHHNHHGHHGHHHGHNWGSYYAPKVITYPSNCHQHGGCFPSTSPWYGW